VRSHLPALPSTIDTVPLSRESTAVLHHCLYTVDTGRTRIDSCVLNPQVCTSSCRSCRQPSGTSANSPHSSAQSAPRGLARGSACASCR
jgi:hypothetical protein